MPEVWKENEDGVRAVQKGDDVSKENESKQILRLAADISRDYYKKPLIITYSGGKDSDVMLRLAMECLNPADFEVCNSHTTIDAPPTVYHIRHTFEHLQRHGIKTVIRNLPPHQTSMWDLIVQKRMPPTRLVRYCCKELKEGDRAGRMVATGVRKAESASRKARSAFEVIGKTKKEALTFTTEHIQEVYEDAKQEAKECGKSVEEESPFDCTFVAKAKRNKETICNPIIDWTDSEIWDFIQKKDIAVCDLYKCGYNRVGCVGCPLSGKKREMEFRDFPTYKKAYISSFDRMIQKRVKDGLKTVWKSGKECFDWWMEDPTIPGQLTFDKDGVIHE